MIIGDRDDYNINDEYINFMMDKYKLKKKKTVKFSRPSISRYRGYCVNISIPFMYLDDQELFIDRRNMDKRRLNIKQDEVECQLSLN